MINDEIMRREVRATKAFYNVSYKQIALLLGISQKSMYNWLGKEYSFSPDTLSRLAAIIEKIKEI